MGSLSWVWARMEKHAAVTYVACSLLLVGCAWFTKDTLFQTPQIPTQDLLQYSIRDSSDRTGAAFRANSVLTYAQSTLRKEAHVLKPEKDDILRKRHDVQLKQIRRHDPVHTMELATIQSGISEHEHPVKPKPPPPMPRDKVTPLEEYDPASMTAEEQASAQGTQALQQMHEQRAAGFSHEIKRWEKADGYKPNSHPV